MTESAEGAFITPGVGTITDAKGKVYAITTAKVATESGAAMKGGNGTGAMCYHSHALYAQDFATSAWYTWNDTTKLWTTSASPVSVAALVSAVSIDKIAAQRVGTAFTVHGTFSFDRAAPAGNLQFENDKGGFSSAVVSLKPGSYAFSFTHTGYAKAGTYTLTVGAPGGATGISNSFTVG